MTDNPQPPPSWGQFGGTPEPDPVAPYPYPPPRRHNRLLPVLVGLGALLVIAGVLTVAVIRSRSTTEQEPVPEAATPPVSVVVPSETPTTTTTIEPRAPLPPSPLPSLPTTTTDALVPQGFHVVQGPAAIRVAIPVGWPVKPGAIPSNREADAPAGGGLVRYGGSPSTSMPLYDTVAGNETANPNVIDGYQRLRLESVPGYGEEAVEWEFTFLSDGLPRHGLGHYWRLNGIDYVVYASAPEESWPSMIPVIDTMIATAQPA